MLYYRNIFIFYMWFGLMINIDLVYKTRQDEMIRRLLNELLRQDQSELHSDIEVESTIE